MSMFDENGLNPENGSFDNFLELPPEHSGRDSSRFVIFTVPYENTTSYRQGAADGPAAIVEASAQVELYDMEINTRAYLEGIATDRSLDEAAGAGFAELSSSIKKAVAGALDRGGVPVILGAEHTVSLPAISQVAEKFRDITVVQIDAHADLREKYHGDPLSHACVMRRAAELKNVSAIVQVGIRSMCMNENEFIDASDSVHSFSARSINSGEASLNDILAKIKGTVYLTIDLDGLDPSEIPAVGTPEPGGLTWTWTTRFIEAICENHNIAAFDIVELCPIPNDNRSEFAAAKLTYRTIGLISKYRK